MSKLNSPYPCWLNKDELEQAEALIKLGFYYCGNKNDGDDEDDEDFNFRAGKIGSWQFKTEGGECCLNAICEGALYTWDLERHPDLNSIRFIDIRIREAKTAIRRVVKLQKARAGAKPNQLSLFN